MTNNPIYDVIIIGGGGAGLSAALVLGLAGRRTLVLDSGRPRNAPADVSHGMLTQDGQPPAQILAAARSQIAAYSCVHFLDDAALDCQVTPRSVTVSTLTNKSFTARKLILATGMADLLPPLPGLAACWGKSIFPCPYCHASEFRDRPLAVLGNGFGVSHLVAVLRSWSADVVLLTNGPPTFDAGEWPRFTRNNIHIYDQPIAAFDHDAGQLSRIRFQNNTHLTRAAVLYHPPSTQASDLLTRLGLLVNGVVRVDPKTMKTASPNVFAAGDIIGGLGAPILAAAIFSGTTAGREANEELAEEDFAAPPR